MRQKQYAPQTGAYIVKVKSGQSVDNWRDFDTARLQISVGQEYHEGEKLKALASWCRDRFNATVLCVNDTLQRHNLMFEDAIDETKADAQASALGRAWVERNARTFAGNPGLEIIRWDEWKNRKAFVRSAMQTDWLYSANTEFQTTINENIMAIWNRRRADRPDLYTPDSFARFFELSKKYLLEETAAFSVMYKSRRAIDIYPGTTLFAATVFQGRQVEGAPAGLGKGAFLPR